MSTSNGKPFYLGTSSNWSFSGRLLQMTHEFLHKTPLPTDAVLFDGSAYDFGWRGDFISDEADIPAIPSPDYAIYLINAVKFHCGQLFHLFDDEEFHRNLQRFYSNPTQKEKKSDLWYIHFLLILAFGKMFILQKVTGTRPSGSEFFQRAMEILPPTYILCQQPIAATEILCCIALYLQCFDHRQAAYIYISQAMRTAMGYGMHTEMPVAQLGEEYVQRCRKIWWTIYLLDRQMTSLMGLPQCMQDTDIQCQVPIYPEASQRTTTLEMHIKLAGVIARISNSIYGADGRLNRKFLVSTKALLESLAGLAIELGQVVPLKLDNPGYGVPRMSASLHLLYHQCIVLATRPLIFCCLKMCLEGAANSKEPTRHRLASIVQMCMESAQQTIIILESLQAQGLLETFLPMDLDALYVSSVILAIAPVIDDSRLKDHASWTHRSLTLLDTIISAGNLIATWRRSEVQQLDQNMEQILAVGLRIPCSSTTVTVADVQLQETSHTETLPFDQSSLQSQALNMMETGTGEDLTADQIMAIANSIQDEDVEWMERAIAENSIW
ncbi:hypothetical protein G7054_g6836 [Neopestalotiopsis clavispora]|nr:hypothetical protein G7054_g6836 [Neopestalotiopsis clavispora]